MNIFIFTTGINYWNANILNSLLKEKNISIKGLYISKPQGGDKGLVKRVQRLLNYGVFNLIKFFFQKYFNNNFNTNTLKEYKNRAKNISTYTGDDFKNCLELAERSTDISILIYFNRIVPEKYITSGKMINIHPSYLPYYKGVQPIFWALLNNEKEIGVTIHRVDAGIDTGPIYEQFIFPVSSNSINDNMCLVSNKVAEILPKTLMCIKNKKITATKQKEKRNNYYSRPSSSDIRLFFSRGKRYY